MLRHRELFGTIGEWSEYCALFDTEDGCAS